MKKIFSIMIAALLLTALPAWSQNESETVPVLMLSANSANISYKGQNLQLRVKANTPFTVKTDADWIHVRQQKADRIALQVDANMSQERSGVVSVTSQDGSFVRTFVVNQSHEELSELFSDGRVQPISATDNNHYGASTVMKSIDGDFSTTYYSNSTVSEKNPARLIYNFNNAHIDYMTYMPTQRAIYSNGNFGKVKVYYKLAGQTDYTLYGDYDFEQSRLSTTIYFGENGLDSVVSIKVEVSSGYNEFSTVVGTAACAEMQFGKIVSTATDFGIFADPLLTRLRSGVTKAEIDAVPNLMARSLAQNIYEGRYDTTYRVHRFPCLRSGVKASKVFLAQGIYDVAQGVTGIMMTKGKHMVVVDCATGNAQLTLEVYGWTCPEGSTFYYISYPLHNGINIVDFEKEWTGLVYIDYNAIDFDKRADIGVHIVNGCQNGILTMDKTNDEMEQIVKHAPYTCIDLIGSRIHLVWETKALEKYTVGQYRRHINMIDSLIYWEHELLGINKYNLVPRNKVLGYVNYDYYMGMGALGVSFKYDQQHRILNPDNVLNGDMDVVWGLSHEWGHLHQLTPYYNWPGLGEVSNNMNSVYNCLRMGYKCENMIRDFKTLQREFVTSDPYAGKTSKMRSGAYQRRSLYKFSQPMYDLFTAMADSTIAGRDTSLMRSLETNECDLASRLSGLYKLQCYWPAQGLKDFFPDLYQSLRQTDTDDDKYALIASAQNAHHDRYDTLATRFPNSVWVKNNYVNRQSTEWQNGVPYILNFIRKGSLICGYDLTPYFVKIGWLRNVALYVNDDYGQKYYCLTQDMYDEFLADQAGMIKAGKFKAMTDDMVTDILNSTMPNYPKPDFPN